MTTDNAVTCEKAETRRARSARLRRKAFDDRMAAAGGERNRLHALVWWWLSEFHRLSPERRVAEFARLEQLTAGLNAEAGR